MEFIVIVVLLVVCILGVALKFDLNTKKNHSNAKFVCPQCFIETYIKDLKCNNCSNQNVELSKSKWNGSDSLVFLKCKTCKKESQTVKCPHCNCSITQEITRKSSGAMIF